MTSQYAAESAVSMAVAEVQGLYGSFAFPERLLQKIWARGDFDAASACTADGRAVRIRHPGRWNQLGGPDFSGAQLVIGGQELTGDVELHLHAKDWSAHGHAGDPAYAGVVLHVVLFPASGVWTMGGGGTRIPVLSLLPLLHHGLEEYASDDAVERLAGRPVHAAQAALSALGREELDTLLSAHASRRWLRKVHYAGERIRRLGWEEACHHTALEILGYRFNRAPMLSVAAAHSLAEWRAGGVAPAEVFDARRERWALQGVRPLNHPRLRLAQYAHWVAKRPDWPERLESSGRLRLAVANADAAGDARASRRAAGIPALRDHLAGDLCAEAVGGNRFDNLVADGFLPLFAAKTGADALGLWKAWFAGDVPAAVLHILRALAVCDGRSRPVGQGPVQGLLGWMLEREAADAGA